MTGKRDQEPMAIDPDALYVVTRDDGRRSDPITLDAAMETWRELKAEGVTASVRPWDWVRLEEERGIKTKPLGRNIE